MDDEFCCLVGVVLGLNVGVLLHLFVSPAGEHCLLLFFFPLHDVFSGTKEGAKWGVQVVVAQGLCQCAHCQISQVRSAAMGCAAPGVCHKPLPLPLPFPLGL